MATTVTSLVNNALRRLGEERINNINDDSPTAVLAAELWPNTRDEVLRDHEWSVAISRRRLSELDIENLTPYDYAYQLPVDPYCLYVINLIDAENESYEDLRPEESNYRIEGRVLYTDVKPCAIKFVKRAEDVSDYDPILVEAMALKLASKLAYRLTQSLQLEQNMIAQYSAVLISAKGREAEEKWQGYRQTTAFNQVRIPHYPRKSAWYE